MNIPKEAIELAKSDAAGDKMRFCDSECDAACDAAVAFDPKFWQALGANVPRPNTRTSARGAQLSRFSFSA